MELQGVDLFQLLMGVNNLDISISGPVLLLSPKRSSKTAQAGHILPGMKILPLLIPPRIQPMQHTLATKRGRP